jgi:urease accessory protein
MPWRLLQLADGAFPTGGYAHSGGLEAAVQLGEAADVRRLVVDVVWQAAAALLPLVRRGHAARDLDALAAVDAAAEAFLLGHVANRASRAQGRALAATCARAFAAAAAIGAAVASRRLVGHHAPLLGALGAALGLGGAETDALALHGAARGVLSAAVRLGRLGPFEAQALHAELPFEAARRGAPDEPTQTAPLLELFGGLHDRLYSRLFQS